MPTPPRRPSNSRPRSKSSSLSDSVLENSRPNSVPTRNGTLTVPTSPSLPTGYPSTTTITTPSPASTPKVNANTNNNTTPRKNGRRRYTPRQIPPQSFHSPPPPPSSPPIPAPKPTPSEQDVAQFIALTQQLNGQMDGLADYYVTGGRWERLYLGKCLLKHSGILYIDAPTCSLNRHYGSEGYQRIVPDLRGCRVDKLHSEDGGTSLVIKVSSSSAIVTLRPPVTDLEKWFAALYRWRSVTRSPSSLSIHSSGSNKVLTHQFTFNL